MTALPGPIRPLLAFVDLLRRNRFAVAPEQGLDFIRAVGLLGPSGMTAIHRAARATLAPSPERHGDFDALFRAHFFGHALEGPGPSGQDDEIPVGEDVDGGPGEQPDEPSESGTDATGLELLARRRLGRAGEEEALAVFRRRAPDMLPRRRSHRRVAHHRGRFPDLRRTLRHAVRFDGEALVLAHRRRKPVQRRILLLIDISGSMKARTDSCLGFAHSLAQVARHVEIFTVGTRLTRVSRPLRHRHRDAALSRVSSRVVDWDGGTRLGDSLAAFLSIPRFAGFARGALVVIISDGLERGDHTAMTTAVRSLSQLAWRLVWLTPLATGDDWRPETRALQSVAPFIDHLGQADSAAALCRGVIGHARYER
ncbi:MAG: VWA domain-containing protein [Alphaproteobacteria bacterium]|nr:VWA domain-containing protein [Alphaproteobacteria bacterium]